jgi:DUF4097 and DUF4098 domain-containing protein YvlB
MATLAAIAPQRAFAADEGHFDRTLTVTGPVDMEVQTGSGDISVRAGSAGTVQIHAKIKAESWLTSAASRIESIEKNPPIQQDGNKITIGRVEDHELLNHISISYEIVTPGETKLHATSGSGSERIEGITGPVETTSGSGSLRVHDIGNDVRANTGSGDVDVQNVKGSARVSSGSGGLTATGVAGSLTASTGSGSVKLEQTAAGDVDVSTGSGDVTLDHVKGSARVRTGSGSIHAEGEPTGPWKLHTGSGEVSVKLPPAAAFDLAAETSSGTIHSDREIAVSGDVNKHELRGKVNGGGVLVELHTSSGSIQID